MERGVFRQRIGPALVAEGVITPDQLKAALQGQERHPSFLLGEIISILHRIPIERIDDVNMRCLVMPIFPEVLLHRLKFVAERDKFAKGLDMETFIVNTELQPRKYEIKHVESRGYEAVDAAGRFEKTSVKRYVLAQANVEVVLTLAGGEKVRGALNARHDSDSRVLEIIEDDDQLKTSLYYELRALFNQKYAKRSPAP